MSFLAFLHEKEIIDEDLYEIALGKSDGESYIYDVLISAGEYDEEEIAQLKSEFFRLQYTDLSFFSKIEELDYSAFETFVALPFLISDNKVSIAISSPNDIEAISGIEYNLSLCEETKHAKPVYYIASQSKIKKKFKEINLQQNLNIEQILLHATSVSASDIHITPFEKTFQIMFRIDGILKNYKTFDIDDFEQISISIKVMAKLDISENRRPQSGSFRKFNIDFRVSTHPTFFGENIVIRILNKDKSMILIEKIGFSEEQVDYLKRICTFSNGMIIFCGPTGSGKTTSIYSLIETMDKKHRNIMTLEDPIEYKISNVRQTEILAGVISFADGIRSILRQDPDVILIGEIRDKETAQMAIRASLTGHLVLTTVHSNNCFGAISRLREFEIPNSLISENIISIIAQRLVRNKSGRGRTIVSEILKISPKLKELIGMGCNYSQLNTQAEKENFKNLYKDCKTKLSNGIIFEQDANNILLTTCE